MSLQSDLCADLVSAKLPRAVVVGCIVGAILVVDGLALATIVFSGPLLPFAMQGAGMILFGSTVFCLFGALTSDFKGMIVAPQEVPATVLGTLGAAVAAGAVSTSEMSPFMTMAVLLALSGVLTGLLFLAIGQYRLANLFRFIPYPVAGGFFAGTGWVLSMAAVSMMCGVAVDWHTLPRIVEPPMLWKWGPGAAYALVLVFLVNRRIGLSTIIGSLLVATALYHLALVLLGISVNEAKAQGLFLPGIPAEGLWPPFGFGELTHVDWNVVAATVPHLLAVIVITLLCMLVHLNGLELATGVKIDMNREFRVAGLIGIVAGAGGSGPGCHTFGLTLPCWMLGADTAWTGIAASVVIGLTLFFAGGLLELVPASVIGGLLLSISIKMLNSWLLNVRRKLHWTDYCMIVAICVTIAVFGFVEGVAAGMIATLAMFAIRLSRVDAIDEEFTGGERRSNKTRSIPDRAILLDQGETIRAYRLRGYIFFGSAYPLVERLGQSLDRSPRPACVLLDFTAVSGCDFSAVNVLCAFVRTVDASGTRVVITAAPKLLRESLRINLTSEVWTRLRCEPDLDRGLELCEDIVIAEIERESSGAVGNRRHRLFERVAVDMERHLDEQVVFEEMLDKLEPWLEVREYVVGDALAVRGEFQEGLQLLVSGTATVLDAHGTRLFECVPGDVLEPQAAFGEHPASATATARDPCRTMMLTPIGRKLLESDDKELSLKLYAFLVSRPSSGRLSQT